MKKFIIGSLVGAVIIFVYSSLSWMMSPVHMHSFHYTPKQDSIMKVLNNSGLSEGMYMMPTLDNRNAGAFDSKYRDEEEKYMKENMGKPFAMILYSPGKNMNACQFIWGFLFNLFAVVFALVIFVMAKDKLTTFFMRWWLFIVIGFIVALNSYLLEWNWMYFPWHYIKGMLIDVFVEWALCGAWLAWYLRKA